MTVAHNADDGVIHRADGESGIPGGYRPGDTVVVFGVGPVGLVHVAKAALSGAGRVIGIDRFRARLDVAEALGASDSVVAPDGGKRAAADVRSPRRIATMCFRSLFVLSSLLALPAAAQSRPGDLSSALRRVGAEVRDAGVLHLGTGTWTRRPGPSTDAAGPHVVYNNTCPSGGYFGSIPQGGTWIVPSHGRLSDTADVASYRNMVVMIRDRVQDLIDKGMTLPQIKAARPSLDFDGRYGNTKGEWTTDMFIEAVYRSLQEKK